MTPPAKLVDHIVDFFDTVASEYDCWAGGLNGRVAARLVDWAQPEEGWHCLDVGTGTGMVASLMADRVGPLGSVIGIDLSEAMLRVARHSRRRNIHFMGMAAERLIFRDASFHLVTYGQSLTYLLDPELSLREAHRVLRPGGLIAISCPRRGLSTDAQEAFSSLVSEVAADLPMALPRLPPDHARFGEPDFLSELLLEAGFSAPSCTQLVTGGRARTPGEWLDLMAWTNPLTHAVISSLGPGPRRQVEADLARTMARLGEDAFHYHHSFTFASARRP